MFVSELKMETALTVLALLVTVQGQLFTTTTGGNAILPPTTASPVVPGVIGSSVGVTDPPVVTAPPVTAPVVTPPSVTAPVVTPPPVTVPVVTPPPVTTPIVTPPPVTAPVVTPPPVTVPIVTPPPVTSPVATLPVVTDPPAVTNPVVTVSTGTVPGVPANVGTTQAATTAPTLPVITAGTQPGSSHPHPHSTTVGPPTPGLVPNNCGVTVSVGCETFGNQFCAPGTLYDIESCVCNHQGDVNAVTCSSKPVYIPNLCNVKVLAGVDCEGFGAQMCGNGTMFDVKWCVCNHINAVNNVTCSS